MHWDVFAKRRYVESYTHVGLISNPTELVKFIDDLLLYRRFDIVRVFSGKHEDLLIEMKITQL